MGLGQILPFIQQYMQQLGPPQDQSAPAPAPAPNPTQPQLTAQPTPQPQQTKAHKLLQILQGGLIGGLSGVAANAQTYAQTGRNAGFGGGLAGGFGGAMSQLPYQQAERGQQLQQQQAQTKLLQAQSDMVQTPYGPLPATLAKVIFPASIAAGAKIGSAQIGATSREKTAEIGGESRVKAAEIGGESREKVAQINQGAGVKLDADTANLVGMPELANQTVGRGTLTNINKLMEAKGYRVQDMGKNGEDQNSGMWLMDRGGNRIKQVSPNSLTFQRGASFAQNKPEVVTDPNDPGYAYYTTAANAMQNNLPSPMGAGTVAAKREAVSEVPTKVGDQKVAFNTALQHADLLQQAVSALGNGDTRTLNSLKNKFSTEFGSSDVTNFQVISNAYAREISKMLAAGHLTDSEIASAGGTLPANASPQQILGALKSYRALAQSKLNMLNQQATASRTQTRSATPAKSGGGRVLVEGKDF